MAENNRRAVPDPSTGAVQIARSFTNAITSPRGDTTGSSASAMRFGMPPSKGTLQIWISGAFGIESTFGDGPVQFPESPPRW